MQHSCIPLMNGLQLSHQKFAEQRCKNTLFTALSDTKLCTLKGSVQLVRACECPTFCSKAELARK